ncbi:MAG: hypothetical protein KF852_19555 [Saprospiraceae bacterium]|nr:hypothetical protein [Saprospiraceae bacterium]
MFGKKPCLVVVVLCLAALLWSCEKQEFSFFSGPGKKPVYVPLAELQDIKSEPPRPITLSGTIFLRDTLLFILEQKKGIHVFSVADPGNTAALRFLNIPAITDFTLLGNRIFADSWRDLVTIDISDLFQIREIDRQTGVFSPLLSPPLFAGIFECVDESKGAVVDWVDAELDNVRCRTFN